MHNAQKEARKTAGHERCGPALTRIDPDLLSGLSRFIESKIGLNFPKERMRDLERGVCSAAAEAGHADVETYIRWLLSAPLSGIQVEMLASHLTVGETYFFRDKTGFNVLKTHILPDLIRSRRGREQRIRIWSAGCSSGEEAYSIAILLSEIVPDLKEWSLTILATDINPQVLKKAAAGVYTEWSFRDTPERIKTNYFMKKGNSFEIAANIRDMVTFSYHNLADDPFPALGNNTSAMDIVFCRNVLMYFSKERAREVVVKLHRCLVDGGWLVISPIEASHAISVKFKAVRFSGATLYRKVSGPETAPPCQVPRPEITTGRDMKEMSHAKSKPALSHKVSKPGTGSSIKISVQPRSEQVCEVPLPVQAREAANNGRLSDALGFCEKAIGDDKLNPSLHYLRATILQEMQIADEAASALKRAIYIDPDFVIAHFSLGCLMYQEGRCREAGKQFENAMALLKSCGHDDILPESEGMSAGRLIEIIQTMQQACATR